MKKIIFEKLIIKNFLSVGEKPVILDFRSGLHGITGINRDQVDRRNGVGKSTIPDAVHFALFGTTIRELKKEFIINNITGRTCEVALSFSINNGKETEQYEVVRTLEPSKCFLYHNQRDVTRDSIVNTTEYISQLLQCTPELFQNCVIMTVNNTVPFMAQKKTEKRKFIEGIFNLEIFSKMLNQLRDEQSDIKKQYETETARQDEVARSVANLKEQQIKLHNEYTNRKETLTNRYTSNTKELTTLTAKISSYSEINVDDINRNLSLLAEKLKDCDTKIQDIGKQAAALETKNEFCFTTMSKIGTDKDVCPTCLKSITSHDVESIKHSKQKYKDEVGLREAEIKALEAKILEHNTLKTKINDAIKKGQNNINQSKLTKQQQENDIKRVAQLNAYNQQVEQDLQHLTDSSDSFDTLIQEANAKLTILTDTVENFKKVLNLQDTVRFVVSEEGVKSYIVKKILNVFNSKLAYYLKKLNSNAFISFNEFFEEQIINDKGKVASYFNFSGAERKAIDLAIMFAFIDMLRLQGNIYFNIQFYDELLDTSLDETGVELVLGLLNEFVAKNNFGIYVISHRKECSKFVTGDLICLEKRNGITTRFNGTL
jgi:DNA repair exonuclease SbcCD ATPase subunit